MSVTYTHTLIAAQPDYSPEPQQITEFFNALVRIGSAPLEPRYALGRFTGELRTGRDPRTGEPISIPLRRLVRLETAAEIETSLRGADDYNVAIHGKGPPSNPPFPVFTVGNSQGSTEAAPYLGEYDYLVGCCARPQPVSMSDWHAEIAPAPGDVSPFESPCRAQDGKRVFHNPYTAELVEAPDAACSRFWIEFECGKLLLPKIEDSFELLASPIVDAARELFRVPFVQGCHWG